MIEWSDLTNTRLDTLIRELYLAAYERWILSNYKSSRKVARILNGGGQYLLEGTSINSMKYVSTSVTTVEEVYSILGGLQLAVEKTIDCGLDPASSDCIWWDSHHRWVDYLYPTGPLNAAKDDFIYFTLETFAEAAELNFISAENPGLWRRFAPAYGEWNGVTTPEWGYGRVQPGDIIGSWLIEDLRKAIGALQWYRSSKIYNTGNYDNTILPMSKNASGYSVDEAESAFNNANWSWVNWGSSARTLYDSVGKFIGRQILVFNYSFGGTLCGPTSTSGEVIAYNKGDARPIHPTYTFNDYGDEGVKEGTDLNELRITGAFSYPASLVFFDPWQIAFGSTITAPSGLDDVNASYEIPDQIDEHDANTWIVHTAQYLVKPVYEYGQAITTTTA